MDKPLVSIIMGSESDWPVMAEASHVLKELSVPFEVNVSSAHRSPSRTRNYARNAEKRGVKVIIAGAGGAAHLAGVIASETVLPVIGVPLESGSLKGADSLYSTVQMPGGIPVATMAIGKSGAKNAALLACCILSLSSSVMRKRLIRYREKMLKKVIESDKRVKKKIS